MVIGILLAPLTIGTLPACAAGADYIVDHMSPGTATASAEGTTLSSASPDNHGLESQEAETGAPPPPDQRPPIDDDLTDAERTVATYTAYLLSVLGLDLAEPALVDVSLTFLDDGIAAEELASRADAFANGFQRNPTMTLIRVDDVTPADAVDGARTLSLCVRLDDVTSTKDGLSITSSGQMRQSLVTLVPDDRAMFGYLVSARQEVENTGSC